MHLNQMSHLLLNAIGGHLTPSKEAAAIEAVSALIQLATIVGSHTFDPASNAQDARMLNEALAKLERIEL